MGIGCAGQIAAPNKALELSSSAGSSEHLEGTSSFQERKTRRTRK